MSIYLIEEELLYLEVTKESKKYLKQVLKNLADYLFFLNNYVADKMGRIEILPIADINTFQEQFKKRKNIKSIEVYFIAPNKRKMDFHEVLEETSKLPNIHSGITTLRTRDNWDGEQLLEKNEFIQSAVEHASCGYAKITVNKRRKNELSTENKTIEKSLDEIIKNGDNIIEKIKNLKE